MAVKPMVLGITGGIGSGKSTVCHFFRVLGIPVYPADQRAKWLIMNAPELQDAILQAFGAQAFIDGRYNASYMAEKVFGSATELKKLNALVHPEVGRDFNHWLELHSGSPLVVKEAAVMIELEKSRQPDKILVVHAPEDIRIARVQKRDPQRAVEEIREIIKKQVPQEEMMKRADFLVDNSGRELIIPQVLSIVSLLNKAV